MSGCQRPTTGRIIIVDLDNTIYDQAQVLRHAFLRVGEFVEGELGVDRRLVMDYLMRLARTRTLRYPIFDGIVRDLGLNIDVRELVDVYRRGTVEFLLRRKIRVYRGALGLLRDHDVVIYTEGNPEVQELKVRNIEANYGLRLRYVIVKDKLDEENAEILRRYDAMAYVGDDPYVDFYVPNRLGLFTIRVLTGLYRKIKNIVEEAYRPRATVRSLSCIWRYVRREGDVHRCPP